MTKDMDFDQQVFPMDVAMAVDDIAHVTGYKTSEISEQIDYLLYKQLIENYFNPPEMFYTITATGKIVLNQKNYLKEGKKSSWTLTKEIATFVTTLGLFLIAAGSFISNLNTTKENEKGIKQMQFKMDSLLILNKQSEMQLRSVDSIKFTTIQLSLKIDSVIINKKTKYSDSIKISK